MCDRLRNFDSWPNDFGFSDGVKGCEVSNIPWISFQKHWASKQFFIQHSPTPLKHTPT